jgi:signal transduction histidine kinase
MSDLKRQVKDLSVVNELAHIVARSPSLSDILEQAVQRLLTAMELHAGAVFLLNKSKDQLEQAVCIGFSEQYQREMRVIRVGDQITGRVARNRQPIFLEDASNDHRITNSVIKAEEIRSYAGIPLCSGGELLGVLTVISRGHHIFDSHDLELLDAVAAQLAVAIDNAQLFEKSAHLAVVEERNWLAREIHDTLAQSLVALTLQLELTITKMENEGDTSWVVDSLRKALDLSRQNLEDARRAVAKLRGDRVAEFGLTGALRQLMQSFLEDSGVEVQASISGNLGGLPINLEEGLYRIAQEALRNISKHAQPRHVSMSLRRYRKQIHLTIKDDGVGFDLLAERKDGHYGIIGMGERASLLGGRVEVHSRAGAGTMVRAVLPVRHYSTESSEYD